MMKITKISIEITIKENRNVNTAPPMYPSQVFLGDKAISWCLPKKYPTRYAKISFEMIRDAGIMYQIRPS